MNKGGNFYHLLSVASLFPFLRDSGHGSSGWSLPSPCLMALAVESFDRPSVQLTWVDSCAFRYILVDMINNHGTCKDFSSIPILQFLILPSKETPISLWLAMCQVRYFKYPLQTRSGQLTKFWQLRWKWNCSEELLGRHHKGERSGSSFLPFCLSSFFRPETWTWRPELQQPNGTMRQSWGRNFEPNVSKKKEEGF